MTFWICFYIVLACLSTIYVLRISARRQLYLAYDERIILLISLVWGLFWPIFWPIAYYVGMLLYREIIGK